MAYGKSKLTRPEVCRLELFRYPGHDNAVHREAKALLAATMERLRVVCNQVVRTWLRFHEDAGTLGRMAAKEPVHPCPPAFMKLVYRQTQDACPDVHGATILAVQKWLTETITRQDSPKSNCKRWRRVLSCDESHWSFNDPPPVRLWNGNGKIVRTADGVAVLIRLQRVRVPGKKTAESRAIEIPILRPKHGNHSEQHRRAYAAACEIADGLRPLSQCQIVSGANGKWFLFLTIDGPEPDQTVTRDRNRVLFVRPGVNDALRFHAGSLCGGFGEIVLDRLSRVRSQLDSRRASWRKDNGDAPMPSHVAESLSATWRNQSSAVCDVLISEVVAALRKRDFGKIVWLDGNNRKAALATAGKFSERDSRELFPFEQLRRKAEKRVGELGIEFTGRANFRSAKRRRAEFKKRREAGASVNVASRVTSDDREPTGAIS